jgi:hypothetical protein
MDTTENLRFRDPVILFKDKCVDVQMFPREADAYAFGVRVD